MTIETRLASQYMYEHKDSGWSPESYKSATGWISLRRSKDPIRTLELDEDSFFLAYTGWVSFVEYALGAYARSNKDVVATIYQYSMQSVNPSHGEQHREYDCHNAIFFGVVGRQKQKILDVIKYALTTQRGVPDRIVQDALQDASKRKQIYCYDSHSILFDESRGDQLLHIEDGRVWRPYEEDAWYTDVRWQRTRDQA